MWTGWNQNVARNNVWHVAAMVYYDILCVCVIIRPLFGEMKVLKTQNAILFYNTASRTWPQYATIIPLKQKGLLASAEFCGHVNSCRHLRSDSATHVFSNFYGTMVVAVLILFCVFGLADCGSKNVSGKLSC